MLDIPILRGRVGDYLHPGCRINFYQLLEEKERVIFGHNLPACQYSLSTVNEVSHSLDKKVFEPQMHRCQHVFIGRIRLRGASFRGPENANLMEPDDIGSMCRNTTKLVLFTVSTVCGRALSRDNATTLDSSRLRFVRIAGFGCSVSSSL